MQETSEKAIIPLREVAINNKEMVRERQEQGQYDTPSDLCIFCVLGAVYAIMAV